jgi:lysozyme family protein
MADYRLLVPFILKWEGGISNHPKDRAAIDPVPDRTGNHTNKGITWQTFKGLSKKLKYEATPQHFYAMPESTWGKIFKEGFWDAVKGDQIRSQAVAEILADLTWGSGVGNSSRIAKRALARLGFKGGPRLFDTQTVNAINAAPEKALFEAIHREKVNFYHQIKGGETFLKGWLNRANELFSQKKNLSERALAS